MRKSFSYDIRHIFNRRRIRREFEEMTKRKALDSGCQPEEKKHAENEKHIGNIVDVIKTYKRSGSKTGKKIKKVVGTSNTNVENAIDRDHFTSLDHIVIAKAEDLSSAGPHPERNHDAAPNIDSCSTDIQKQSTVAPDINSSCSEAISTSSKQYKYYSRRAKNKHNVTSSRTHPSFKEEITEKKYEFLHTQHYQDITKKKDEFLHSQTPPLLLQKEITEKLGNKEVIHAVHELKRSHDALALDDEVLTDDSGKVPEASRISAEGNLKVISAEHNETPPIGGSINNLASFAEANEKKLSSSSVREEVNLSSKTAEKSFLVESSGNHSDKASSGIKSNKIPSCNATGTVNSQEEELDSQLMNHTANNGFTSDLIISHDKKSETVIPKLERILVSCSKRKLLVLDLNGLLVDIVFDNQNFHKAQKKVGGKSVFKRPFCDDFLKFCFETFDIGVWSSRRKYNVDNVLDSIMGDGRSKLLFCWDQSHCTYTGFKTLENEKKPLVLKELKKLWNKEETDLPWEMGAYSPSNTLLIDDSPYKALCNPPHTAIFPYPYHFGSEHDTSLGPGGDLHMYLEGLSVANDVQLYVQDHPFGQPPITNKDSAWNFYLQVIEKVDQSSASTKRHFQQVSIDLRCNRT